MGSPFNVHCPRDFVLKMTADGTVSNVKVSFNPGTQEKINKKLYEVQQMIDSEVLRRCDPLVPFDTGTLKQSGIEHTELGSGNDNLPNGVRRENSIIFRCSIRTIVPNIGLNT